jgi:hypothetical protein
VGRAQRMNIDERIVQSDTRMRRADVADASHVGSEVINLVDILGHLQAFGMFPEVCDNKLVGVGPLVFWRLDVCAAHDMSTLDEILDEMVSNKSARTGNQNRRLISHANCSLNVSLQRFKHLPSAVRTSRYSGSTPID